MNTRVVGVASLMIELLHLWLPLRGDRFLALDDTRFASGNRFDLGTVRDATGAVIRRQRVRKDRGYSVGGVARTEGTGVYPFPRLFPDL